MPEWAGRRVIVTGAAGFIGGAIARRLAALDATVVGIARHAADDGSGVRMASCELTDVDQCRALMDAEQPDVVIHAAGHPFAARDLSRIIPTFQSNLETTVNLLTCTAERKVSRIVLFGSLEEPEPTDGLDAASSPYAMSKWAASGYARLFHRLYDHPVVVARVFMVYGPGQRDFTKLIPGSIVKLRRGEAPRIASGDRLVDWIFVDDVVDGVLACATAPGVEGHTVEIGTGVMTTVREIVETLSELIPGSPAPEFGSVPPRPNEQIRRARVDRTQALVGWSPHVSLRDGLARTIEWVSSVGDRAQGA